MFVFDLVSPKAVEKWGTEFGKHPVGAGPFKFVEWKVGQEVILEPNKDFWDKANMPVVGLVEAGLRVAAGQDLAVRVGHLQFHLQCA